MKIDIEKRYIKIGNASELTKFVSLGLSVCLFVSRHSKVKKKRKIRASVIKTSHPSVGFRSFFLFSLGSHPNHNNSNNSALFNHKASPSKCSLLQFFQLFYLYIVFMLADAAAAVTLYDQ